MVICFTSNTVDPPAQLFMGRDKVENEDLIKYQTKDDVWFHVDKLSSAHVYLRLPAGMTFETIPELLLQDVAQLTKANSIMGNKKSNVTIIYTRSANLKKDGSMAVGAVGFVNDTLVRRVYVKERENAIVNRLMKTKIEKVVDHEAEKTARLSQEAREKRAEQNTRKNEALTLSRARLEERAGKSYDSLFAAKSTQLTLEEEEAEWERKQKTGDFDPDDDFM